MRVDILKEIEKRSFYYLPNFELDPAYLNADLSSDTLCLIMPERSFLNAYNKSADVLEGSFLCGLFDLGECYSPYVDLRFSLYLFTKKPSERIKTAIYKESIYVEKNRKEYNKHNTAEINYLQMPDEYCDTYLYYIDSLETWIQQLAEPSDTFYASYNTIRPNEYHHDEPYSARYSQQSMLIHEKLKKEATVELSSLADVIKPDENDIKPAPATYVWNMTEFEYPLKDEYFRTRKYGGVINFPLQKGDILLCSSGEGYQINFIPDVLSDDVYCPSLTIVIRAKKNVSPYYLFLYLHSETGKTIMGDKHRGSVIKYLSLKEIQAIPVIKPERSERNYRKLFEEIFINQQKIDVFSACYKKQDNDTIEDILNDELTSKAMACKNKLAREIIKADFQEVKTCFDAGAYKATLIMAGSVMEAFLIDWLSELHGKDYFSEKIVKEDGKEANLYSIIDMIKKIKTPEWMKEAKHAQHIRKKRNLVHAKLCLNEAEKINASLCKKVLKYLSQIIETRYKR